MERIYEDYNFKGKRILIVDDEEINFLMLKDMLIDTGAEIFWAHTGQKAIDLVQSGEQYDVVLMDMKMPVLDGFQTTMEIKKLSPTMKVLAQTAYALDDEQNKCYEAGCDDYLSKPISMNDLFEMVDKHIH